VLTGEKRLATCSNPALSDPGEQINMQCCSCEAQVMPAYVCCSSLRSEQGQCVVLQGSGASSQRVVLEGASKTSMLRGASKLKARLSVLVLTLRMQGASKASMHVYVRVCKKKPWCCHESCSVMKSALR
jgi:hypothetical protein